MYHITTRKRSYNSVDNAEKFKVIRDNWKDYSDVVDAFIWMDEMGWVPIAKEDFEADKER